MRVGARGAAQERGVQGRKGRQRLIGGRWCPVVDLLRPHTGCNRLQNSLPAGHRITQDAFELDSRSLPGFSPRVLYNPLQDRVSQQTLNRIWVNTLLSVFESYEENDKELN